MEYNKAIQYLKEHTAKHSGAKSLAVSLIACVLFITLELFTGRIDKATIHLNERGKLLRSWIQNVSSTTNSPGRESRKPNFVLNPQSVEDELVSIFAHLDLQSMYFGSGKPQLKLAADSSTAPAKDAYPNPLSSFDLPAEFHSIHEANQYLIIITNECLHFTDQNIDHAELRPNGAGKEALKKGHTFVLVWTASEAPTSIQEARPKTVERIFGGAVSGKANFV
jgi:hypothetical protein